MVRVATAAGDQPGDLVPVGADVAAKNVTGLHVGRSTRKRDRIEIVGDCLCVELRAYVVGHEGGDFEAAVEFYLWEVAGGLAERVEGRLVTLPRRRAGARGDRPGTRGPPRGYVRPWPMLYST